MTEGSRREDVGPGMAYFFRPFGLSSTVPHALKNSATSSPKASHRLEIVEELGKYFPESIRFTIDLETPSSTANDDWLKCREFMSRLRLFTKRSLTS